MKDDAPLDPRHIKIPAEVLELVPMAIMDANCVLPLAESNGLLTLFCPDDRKFDLAMEDMLRFALGRDLKWIRVNRRTLEAAIKQQFAGVGATVQNCAVFFRFKCPKTWESLELTESSKRRFCVECQNYVYLCSTEEEARAMAKQNRCVAYGGASFVEVGMLDDE